MNLDKVLTLAERARKLPHRPGNKDNGDWYRISNAASDMAEIFIYGVIGSDWMPGDVTADQFVKDLKNISASTINLHINSPGGMVWDGLAIYAALKNHEATVDVMIDGVAASTASWVALAGDSVSIEKPAKMFIHDAHGLVIGNAQDMREAADMYDELSDTIAEIYADSAGGEIKNWREAMKKETWYSSDQAVTVGLADRVIGEKKEEAAENRSQLIRARSRVTLGRG